VAKDHAQVDNFRTTDGGHVYAASFDGSLTGFGADVIIVDDAHNQSDAGFPRKLERTIEKFHGLVIGRLNNPKNGRVLVVGHRIHECDLSADLIANGGWTHVALPAIARQKKRYKTNYGDWRRRKGQTLRADTPRADFERLGERLVNPPFELLYLQGCGEQLPSIKAEHFKPFDKARVENLPHFLSVDAASKDGSASSFSVVQLWASDGSNLFLVNQFREQCDFARLSHVVRNLARHYNGVPILIEDTANGCALLSDLRKRNIHAIVPSGSKEARFRPHLEKIIAGKVHVPANAPFAREFMKEFLEFPHGEYNDQVDAFSQFAGWIEDRRDIDFSRKNFSVGGLGVIARDSDPPSGVPSAAYPQSGNPARGLIAIARPQRHPFFPTRR
jgi:predicted phage terminase large subunit-like protein